MEANATLLELVMLNLFLGSVIYFFGIVFQIFITVRNKNRPKSITRVSSLLVLSLVSSVFFSLIIWKFWMFNFDVMLGPILLPVLISEIIILPVMLKLFGYKIFKINKAG